jgi:small subunit ribosomal protein S17
MDTTTSQVRKPRKTLTGIVSKKSGSKTVKVEVAYKVPHPRYLKEVSRTTVLSVHDEKNELNIGDKVTVTETRPLSKTKRFRLLSVVSKSSDQV